MLYHATESNINLFFQKLGHMSDDVIFMSRVKKIFLLTIIMRTDKFESHIYEDLSIKIALYIKTLNVLRADPRCIRE